MATLALLAAAAVTATLHGQLTDVRDAHAPRYDFGARPGRVFVFHHMDVVIGCNTEPRGPTIAAPTFNQIVTEYAVDDSSRLQVLDISDLDAPDLYAWWVQTTAPNHPVLMDDKDEVLGEIQSTDGWPEVVIVDCHGVIKYKKKIFATEATYAEQLKPVIDEALADATCPTIP